MEQISTPYTYYRGGTSKAAIVLRSDLPVEDEAQLEAWILAIYGSPDRRQIDGIGGADILTSKFAVVGPSTRPDADVDYTFYQVDILTAAVHRGLNCGNISAAIGPFAIDSGLVQATDPVTPVRIHATNFGRVIHALVPTLNGRARVSGDTKIDGVPGTGAAIELDFRDTVGGLTGALLPTGNVVDLIAVDGVGLVEMSIVDLANLVCYVRAETLGLEGTEDPVALAGDAALMERCERIRLAVAAQLGIAPDFETALAKPPATPWLGIVSPPKAWHNFATGAQHPADACDLAARLFTRRNIHKAYPGTGTACLGVAAAIPGTIPNQIAPSAQREASVLRIGHPCGVITVKADVQRAEDGALHIGQASFTRTARRIADGNVYAAVDRLAWLSGS